MPKPSEIREIALSNTRFLSPPTVPPVGGAMLPSNQTQDFTTAAGFQLRSGTGANLPLS